MTFMVTLKQYKQSFTQKIYHLHVKRDDKGNKHPPAAQRRIDTHTDR